MQRSMKHVIILISSILFVLVMLLCFSGKTFAAEPLPVASAEDGAEDTQQEKADPEAGPDGETGGSGEADAGRFTAVEDDAAHENKSGEEVSGDAADENNTSVVKNKVPEPEETENAVPEPEETENAVPEPAETENAVPEPAETENAVPEPAETENTVTDPAGKKDEVGTVNKVKPADPEPLAGLTGLSADKGNTVVTGAPGSDDLNDDSDDNSKDDSSSDKPDVTIDPLTYLQECLTYHGDEKDPSAYSLRAYTKDGQSVVTEVKDQNPWPTCWGFGAIAASETSILSECYAKWDQLAPGLREKYGINSFRELCEKLDLSERQIAWFTFMPEPKNGNYPSQEGEGLYANQEGIGGVYNALGASYYATSVFARGTGPLEEKDVPYQNNEGVLNDGVKITDKNGKEHIDRDYCDLIKETREIEYSFPIPQGMTKQELIDKFIGFPDIQEKVRQILEKGFFTDTETVCKYVDDSGKYYSIVRVNPLTDLLPEYPEILIYQGEDGKRYAYDPVTKTYPGLPALHKAY